MEDENKEFDDAFAEFSGGETDSPPAGDEVPPDEEAGEEEGAGTEGGEKAADGGEEKGGEPPGEEDPWAGLPDEMRERVTALIQERDQLKHSAHSNAGRVRALQRKIDELTASKPATEQPSAEEVQEAMKTPEAWASFQTDYPTIASAMEARFEAERKLIEQQMNQRLQPLSTNIQSLGHAEHERFLQAQYAALEAAHPDWREVAASAEFNEWMGHQPEAIRNLGVSERADEVSTVLTYFKTSRQRPPAPADEDSPSPVSELQQRRRKQLEEGAAPPAQRGSGARTAIPEDDFDAAFRAYAAKKQSR